MWRGIATNRALAVTLPLTLAALPLAILVPGITSALHFAPLEPAIWAMAVGTGVLCTLWFEPFKGATR